ncbi:MAG: hypothetical protein HY898_35240 [Deltaproteobacteria bacterium]|nr:hypothetical protein [Deltaproteobacteria bacterium]
MYAILIAALLALLAPATAFAQQPSAPGQPDGCNAPITAEQAQAVFESFKAATAEEGCKFEGIKTERSQMKASWSKGGSAVEPVVVVPRACAPGASVGGERFSANPAPGLEQACPATWRAVAEAVRTRPYPSAVLPAPSAPPGSADRPTPPVEQPPPPPVGTRIGIAVTILLVGAIAVVLVRRRGASRGDEE